MQELSLDRWRVHWLIYNGHPAIMASYVFPHTRSAPMRRGMDSMASNFQDFNFAKSDRYLQHVSDATNSCTAELVETGLTVQFRGNSAFPGCGVPDDDWIDLATSTESCMVIITVGDVDSDGAGKHLRRQMGTGLGRAARVPFFDHRTPGYGLATSRYRFLGPTGETVLLPPGSSAVSLDSNVLLDLEKAAQGKVPAALHRELQGLVRNLRYQDCRPGFAISELCWTGTSGQYKISRETSLLAAMDAWFDDRSIEALSAESVKQRWETQLEFHQRNPSKMQYLDIRRAVSVTYCCLLKLASLLLLVNGFKANQRVELFAEYCRWANEDHGAVVASPLQVAFDGLLGPSADVQYVRKLLKFSKSPLRNLWGAAWDLSMLWLATDLVAAGKSFNPFQMTPVLVTADKGLAKVRSRLAFEGFMQNSGRTDDWRGLVGAHFEWDTRLSDQGPAIRKIVENLQNSIIARLDPEGPSTFSATNLQREIQRLEKKILDLTEDTESVPTSAPEVRITQRSPRWKRLFGRFR